MEFSKQKTIDGVVQRDFEIEVAGETVPCVVWAPERGEPAPVLICMGHGGSQHKKTAGIRSRAVEYAQRLGWATLAIDAPGHGDRISRDESENLARETEARVTGRASGATWTAERLRWLTDRVKRAVPEWKAALDAALGLPFVVPDANVGYWGVSMGTVIGVPFVAAEPRVRAAVFGLAGTIPGVEWGGAERIEIPVQFVFQWDDAVAPREAGIALFNAFASKQKTMHINPGGHLEIPIFERDAWLAFYVRHLGAE